MKQKIFIGLAWPYVNGDLHIGHLAGYLLPADIFARFHRFLGNDVLMVSGSDCFGTPITLEAEKRKIFPKQVVQEYHPKFLKLFKQANIKFDLYTRTDTKNHQKVVQDFFLKLFGKGFIFKDKTEQYYSQAEKKFLPDRYVEGTCPICRFKQARSDQCEKCNTLLKEGELINPKSKLSQAPVELKQTEHYFFDWPKLQKFLEKYIKSKTNWREWVYKETFNWLKKGLKPRAITRDITWGVEIPKNKIPKKLQIENIKNKRIYVWFEAVIGYLSGSIEWAEKTNKNWRDFWYNTQAKHFYFMGKDNLIFHTLFWPGQLYAYDKKINLPDFPAINQFLTLENQKFSKSRGIYIDSSDFVEKYGSDAVRFYLCAIMPEKADADFTWQDFISKNNNILIGNLGNFINRSLTLAKNLNFKNNLNLNLKIEKKVSQSLSQAKVALGNCQFRKYLETILDLSDFGNKYIAQKKPWALKNNKQVIFNCGFIVLALCALIKPLMPNAYKNLSSMLNLKIDFWPEIKILKKLVYKIKIKQNKPLFKKIP
ncbi:MAG: methionine--tRNA ligase [bacterium]